MPPSYSGSIYIEFPNIHLRSIAILVVLSRTTSRHIGAPSDRTPVKLRVASNHNEVSLGK